MRDQIIKLTDLQALDAQIYSLIAEKERKPQEIENINNNFEERKKILDQIDKEKKDLLKIRKDKELELASKEENVKKLQVQLYQLKTNKEYQAMLEEIEGLKADSSLLEEELIKLLDKADNTDLKVKEQREELAKEEKEKNQKIDAIKKRIDEIEHTLKDLNFKRSRLTKDIDPKILSVYERILKNRSGLALVEVKDNACQGCFMNVPPQVINEIKMKERLVVCEMCSRILYIKEDIFEKN